ncbi:Cof-type HAD-IIB family hydrolase [Anaerosporobacter sp.]|uniref:Cof-type HAD-IIB family hydrolase n=1 Tax=Anaerosporobacter sp. TaxID=1872529 RepID=UPI00286F1F48|nr:Cof-type HAD-IIB family hydrolase [Anaerosporobacter sp.]
MKVIFLDIDGTLVDYETHLPESAAQAVRETVKNGNKVYLTTGRSKAEIYPYLWDIGINGMIGGNGMYIEDDGEVIQDLTMNAKDEKDTVDWLNKKKLGFYLESREGLYASEYFLQKTASTLYEGNQKEGEEKIKEMFPHMIWDGELYRSDVAKISFVLEDKALEEAESMFGDRLKVSSWSGTGKKQEFGEFAIKGMDKVCAVELLLKHLQANHKDTFAFGDAASDKKMLEYCNVGIAMGNAEGDLKEIADYVTADVNDDGLWKAFQKYELI